MQDKIIYTQKYIVNTTNVNYTRKLGLLGMLGFLQDAASEHAEEIGFGYHEMIEKGTIWVLIRQKLKMYRWPEWREELTISTWSKPVKGLYAFREFEIYAKQEKIGECSTTWMILDTQNRRPVKAEIVNSVMNPRENYSLDFTAEKINLPDHFSDKRNFIVRNSDIDMNGHVNNIRYAQWSLDSIPFEYHQKFVVQEFDINFIAETFLKDQIECFSQLDSKKTGIFFKGIRKKDEKLVFAARIAAKLA